MGSPSLIHLLRDSNVTFALAFIASAAAIDAFSIDVVFGRSSSRFSVVAFALGRGVPSRSASRSTSPLGSRPARGG